MARDTLKPNKSVQISLQILFLIAMNRPTRNAIVLFAMYLIVSLGLTLVVLKVQGNNKTDMNAKQIVPAKVTDRL